MRLGKDETLDSRLKHFVNGKMLDLEEKGQPAFSIENQLFIAITSNKRDVIRIPPSLRHYAAYWVKDAFEVDEEKPKAHWLAMRQELESGVLEALMHNLLNTDLTNFNPRFAPRAPFFYELAGISSDRTPHTAHCMVAGRAGNRGIAVPGGQAQLVSACIRRGSAPRFAPITESTTQVSCNYAAAITVDAGQLVNAAGANIAANDAADFTNVLVYDLALENQTKSNSGPFQKIAMKVAADSTTSTTPQGAFHENANLGIQIKTANNPKRPVAGDYVAVTTISLGAV